MKTLLVLLSALLLTACTPKVWYKPGSTQDEFSRDKYDCVQQAQQRVSGAYVDAYGGVANNHVITNNNLFNSCMNSRGWYLGKKGETPPPPPEKIQARQRVKESKNQLVEIQKDSEKVCLKPEYKIILDKTPCKIDSVTLTQLSNNDKITEAEKLVFVQFVEESKKLSIRRTAAFRSGGTQQAFDLASLNERSRDNSDNNALELYEGKISWGEYNKNRKKTNASAKEEYERITRRPSK